MTDASIPTMPCWACYGIGRLRVLVSPWGEATTVPCTRCAGTGRIPRPPLTPDQVAALSDGALVVVDARGHISVFEVDSVTQAAYARMVANGAVRVWLADGKSDETA